MSRKIPNQKKKYQELEKRINTYTLELERIFETLNTEAARLALTTSYDNTGEELFSFKDFPETKYGIERLQEQYVNDIRSLIYSSTSQEWVNSNLACDLIADGVIASYTGQLNRQLHTQYYQTNSSVLKAFQQRRDRGLNISDKLWRQSRLYRDALESTISIALERGTSAVTLSKRISQYLKDYPTLQKDYTEKYGKAARIYDCEYRAARLARSEINIAYRTAEQTRWQQMDFVLGYEVKLSDNHNCKGVPKGQFFDICDELAGKYPKDFKFVGWHPQCYSSDSEVLTNRGWKLFKDVLDNDLILSLNPTNRNLEYVSIVDRQCWHHKGVMYHFYNKSLDCLVTPEHSMIYLNKSDGAIKRCEAKDFKRTMGAFYRGCLYNAEDVQTITIGRTVFAFDWFCEFMGYWLSDGSTIRKSEISISQQDGEKAKDYIVSCIKNGGFKPHVTYGKIEFYCTDLCQYLKKFGKCTDKYVPNEIKNSSPRQIRIFLDAYIKCDGIIRKPKSFIGNRGNEFIAKSGERMYFTTSELMAGDLSELILKSGKRPSFYISHPKISVKKDGSIIKPNYDCYRISECNATTATVFEKETIDYDANVYDLTLERNHIMYIRRNGKCFWGSNCRCYTIPILKTDEEYLYDLPGKNEVKDFPEGFKKWMNDNSERYDRAKERGTLPYFVRDNKETMEKLAKSKSIHEISANDIKQLEINGFKFSGFGENIATSYNDSPIRGFDLKSFDSLVENVCDKNQILISDKKLRKVKTDVLLSYSGQDSEGGYFSLYRSFREFDGKRTVIHSNFVLPENLQGKGISKTMFKELFKQYEAMGINEVVLQANMHVGGYAWAKYGFSANKSDVLEILRDAYEKRNVININVYNELVKVVNEHIGETFPMNIIANIPEGKKILLDQDWVGKFDMSDKNQLDYLKNYMR